MLTPRNIEWIAGFIEGEGCFSFSTCARVLVNQVQLEPLLRLQKYIGGTINLHKCRGRPIHAWKVTARTAIGLMLTIYPLMSPRRQGQMLRVLNLWKAGRGSGCHQREKTECVRGHPYSEENTRYYINSSGYRARECWTCRRTVFGPRSDAKKKATRKRLKVVQGGAP